VPAKTRPRDGIKKKIRPKQLISRNSVIAEQAATGDE
jgi:hypothetical protein